MATARPIRKSDLEPLHEVYCSMVGSIPHHPAVTEAQFSRELLTYSHTDVVPCVDESAGAALVVERGGKPVALALTALLAKDHSWDSLKAGTGVLRLLLAPPHAQDEALAVIEAAKAHLRAEGAESLLALHYVMGPGFHNTGCAMLPATWPWLGHWLYLSGFRAKGSEIRFRRPMDDRPDSLELPAEGDLRVYRGEYGWPGESEFRDTKHLFIDDRDAAQCHNAFAGYYVDGAGRDLVHTEWLGVGEDFRGRGLGRAMLRQGLVRAWDEGARVATLTTAGKNFRAQALYVSEGYVQTDTMWEFELAAE
jgi:ribosomal protein S18 acetylase RimI-like enzyme